MTVHSLLDRRAHSLEDLYCCLEIYTNTDRVGRKTATHGKNGRRCRKIDMDINVVVSFMTDLIVIIYI